MQNKTPQPWADDSRRHGIGGRLWAVEGAEKPLATPMPHQPLSTLGGGKPGSMPHLPVPHQLRDGITQAPNANGPENTPNAFLASLPK